MTLILTVSALIVLTSAAFTVYHLIHAPEGFEDESGFHTINRPSKQATKGVVHGFPAHDAA